MFSPLVLSFISFLLYRFFVFFFCFRFSVHFSVWPFCFLFCFSARFLFGGELCSLPLGVTPPGIYMPHVACIGHVRMYAAALAFYVHVCLRCTIRSMLLYVLHTSYDVSSFFTFCFPSYFPFLFPVRFPVLFSRFFRLLCLLFLLR